MEKPQESEELQSQGKLKRKQMKEQKGKRHKKQKTGNNLEQSSQHQNETNTHIQTSYPTNNINTDHNESNPNKKQSNNANPNTDPRYDDTNGAGCSFWPSQNLDNSIWSQETITDNTPDTTHTPHTDSQNERQNTPSNENTQHNTNIEEIKNTPSNINPPNTTQKQNNNQNTIDQHQFRQPPSKPTFNLTRVRNITSSIKNLPHPSDLKQDDSPLKQLLSRIQHSHFKYKKELDIWSKEDLQEVIDSLSENQIKIWGPYINKWKKTHPEKRMLTICHTILHKYADINRKKNLATTLRRVGKHTLPCDDSSSEEEEDC